MMKPINLVYSLLVLSLSGCGGAPGATGPAGAIGATGVAGASGTNGTSAKFTAGISCFGTISGATGAAGTALNGLVIKYKAYLNASGDVYAYAAVSSSSITIGGTEFYSVTQVGSDTGAVLFIDDFATPNSGYWSISTNRTTLVVTAVYTDNSLAGQSPVTITFASSACTAFTF